MTRFFANVAGVAGMWLFSAWTLMLGVGIVRAEWLPTLPTIGFGSALLVASILALRAVIGQVMALVLRQMENESPGGDVR